jgi:hypothetical protein
MCTPNWSKPAPSLILWLEERPWEAWFCVFSNKSTSIRTFVGLSINISFSFVIVPLGSHAVRVNNKFEVTWE